MIRKIQTRRGKCAKRGKDGAADEARPSENKPAGRSPMDAALSCLGYSARTAREVERFLDEKEYGEVEIYETVERLKELKLLDDGEYARAFVESRLRAKPVSRRHLREQLTAHEADAEAIETALSEITDAQELDNAVSLGEKYARKYERLDARAQARRVYQRLYACGFDSGVIRAAVERLFDGAEEWNDLGDGD